MSPQNRNYANQREYMESLRSDKPMEQPDDLRTPFTYKEWISRNPTLKPGDEYSQYTRYVRDWYDSAYTGKNTLDLVKRDYYSLLLELQSTFKDTEDFNRIARLDISNDLDLEEAIPFFAKRLKEIAIYFINKRDAIKQAKLKYNMVGGKGAMERLFYEHILKAFARRDYVLNVPEQSAYDTFPALSSIKDGFQINIEELYDDTEYFDKDPNVPVSNYYDLSNPELIQHLSEKSMDESDASWAFGTGISDVYADNPLVWTLSSVLEEYGTDDIDDIPLSAFSSFDRNLLNDYVKIEQSKKYLGEHQYVLSGGYYKLKTNDFSFSLEEGNNWFYWPSGEYFLETPDSYFDPILLVDTNLIADGAIASDNYEDADKIFVEQSGSIKAAWLYSNPSTDLRKTMRAQFLPFSNSRNGKGYQFIFPFPDYGLSGEDIEYTKPGFDNVGSLYNVLSPEIRKEVQHAYWNFDYSLSSIDPILIHDTNLIDQNAKPGEYYNDADKVIVRRTPNPDNIHDNNPDSVYTEEFERAWLYKFNTTDIPITVGQNYIHWPVHPYERDDESMEYNILSSQCVSMDISLLKPESSIIGARAGYGLFDSDIIYKLDSWNGYPIECAWLSGVDLSTLASPDTTLMYNATGKIQPSFTLRCRPGREEKFVWQDSPRYIDETTIVHHNHQVDCPYANSPQKSIHKTKGKGIDELQTNGIGNWMDCNCKSILYSPLGHPGNEFSDYNSMADFIFVDTQFPDRFDIKTWRGTDGLPYYSSKDFAWFKLHDNNPIEEDVGWGPGEWKTGDGSRFEFKPGVLYQYVRADLKRNPAELILDVVPRLIIKERHYNTPQTKWMKAELNPQGEWDKLHDPSDMVLEPGDYLMYDHIDSFWFCLSTEGDYGEYTLQQRDDIVSENRWSNYIAATTGIDVSYAWPSVVFPGGPSKLAPQLTKIDWAVEYPSGTTFEVDGISPTLPFVFTVSEIGEYIVTAKGYGSFGEETITIKPNLSGTDFMTIPAVSGSLGVETIYNDRINMTINKSLSGWNYETNNFDPNSIGGRPFWAVGYDDSRDQTKQKGVRDWGGGIRYPIDDYTPVLQPDISELEFNFGDFVEYRYMGDTDVVWEQPVSIHTDYENKQWSELIVDPQVTSPLSSFMYNLNKELIVSATKTPSDISLQQLCEETTFINYYANEPFTWTQTLTDTSVGVPPYGGIWVDPQTEVLIDPINPYAHLTNRHYPTIATVPYVPNLFSSEDSGGFFVPKNLGVSVYQTKQFTTEFNTDGADGVIYQNMDIYSRDYGLTRSLQKSPIEISDSNSNWMKSGVTTSGRSGFVQGVKDYQPFIPYQSKYESVRTGNVGIRFTTDDYTPWKGEKDNEWRDVENFPSDFRGQYPILNWYDQFPLQGDFKMSNWKIDVYGNNYALFKPRSVDSIYEEKHTTGELWVRNTMGVVGRAKELLSDVYNKTEFESTIYNDLITDNILDFDIIYDTIIIETTEDVVIQKLNIDYNTGRIFSIADDLRSFKKELYAGHWFDETNNNILLSNIEISNDTVEVSNHQINGVNQRYTKDGFMWVGESNPFLYIMVGSTIKIGNTVNVQFILSGIMQSIWISETASHTYTIGDERNPADASWSGFDCTTIPQIINNLYTYNINNGTIFKSKHKDEVPGGFDLEFRSPIYSYNSRLHINNTTFLGYNQDGMHIIIFNVIGDKLYSYMIQPVNNYISGDVENSEKRNLINKNILNNEGLILTFEGEDSNNIYNCLIKDYNIENN